MLGNPQVRFGGGQTKKEQQCHLVGWLPTFEHISHEALLRKLNAYPQMRRLIKGWLKAGVLEDFQFSSTEAGTPQGGVISPLLANIALHGLEGTIVKAYRDKDEPQVIRYADDFVGAT
jgi:RNA-directed DNA polymerase